MQNSSQTKDLIKDHFSFTAFFYNHCSVLYPQWFYSPLAVALSLLDVVIFIESTDIVP